jgi:malate dehydrogenase (oxaloacetate-decarboxylating)(NADP+)
MDSGVARRPIIDIEAYELDLKSRLDPVASVLQAMFIRSRNNQAHMLFAEGQDPKVLRAAVAYARAGLGKASVVGREADVKQMLEEAGMPDAFDDIEVVNARVSEHLETYKEFLYERLQRKGYDMFDVHKLASRDRHVFAALMVEHGHADAMITGATRKSSHVMRLLNHVYDVAPGDGVVGVNAILKQGRMVLVADTLVNEWPDQNDLADIAQHAAKVARNMGLEPRVAFVSFSNFGYPPSERAEKMKLASKVLDERHVDFEYEGEMTVDVALNTKVQVHYPFSRLTGPANILVMPARHSASISVKMMQELGGATVIGPIMSGIPKPIQLCSVTSSANDILNMAVMASCDTERMKGL